MFCAEDMIDDGISHNEIYQALDACLVSLRGMDSKGSKAVRNIIESAIDDIEMMEAMGDFDDE